MAARKPRYATLSTILVVLFVAAACAYAGVRLYGESRAAGVFLAVQPDSGNITAPAVKVQDSSADGGSAVQFRAVAPSPSPAPPSNPGPAGDFSWKGYNWVRRPWAGGPAYNGSWSTGNVIGPDASGHMTLRLTNPTGSSPVSAEFSTTRKGFGYGTYTSVVEGRLDLLHKSLVFGGLFTYDGNLQPHHNEIDVHETSAWGRQVPVELNHTYWKNVNGNNVSATGLIAIPSDSIQTHRLVWEPGKLTFDSFRGQGTGGTLIKRTIMTDSIPVPANETLIYNLWAFNSGAANASQVEVKIRDFSFTPR